MEWSAIQAIILVVLTGSFTIAGAAASAIMSQRGQRRILEQETKANRQGDLVGKIEELYSGLSDRFDDVHTQLIYYKSFQIGARKRTEVVKLIAKETEDNLSKRMNLLIDLYFPEIFENYKELTIPLADIANDLVKWRLDESFDLTETIERKLPKALKARSELFTKLSDLLRQIRE